MEREHDPLTQPPPLDRVIRTCLAKDPDERFQSARDVKRDLLCAMETTTPSRSRLGKTGWIAAGVIAVAFTIYYFRASNTASPETRVDIVTPPTSSTASFALSPD